MKHYPSTENSKCMISLATHLCAIKCYIKSEQIADESGFKVRLVINAYGMLILDGMIGYTKMAKQLPYGTQDHYQLLHITLNLINRQ